MSPLTGLNTLGGSHAAGCTGGYSHLSLSEKQLVDGCSFRACLCQGVFGGEKYPSCVLSNSTRKFFSGKILL